MIAQARPKRPNYEWIRTLALAELPHQADRIRPDFWNLIAAGVGQMKPSQRKIYTLYRCGMSAPAIATLMGCKKRSVYARLGEIDAILKTALSGDTLYSKRVTRKSA